MKLNDTQVLWIFTCLLTQTLDLVIKETNLQEDRYYCIYKIFSLCLRFLSWKLLEWLFLFCRFRKKNLDFEIWLCFPWVSKWHLQNQQNCVEGMRLEQTTVLNSIYAKKFICSSKMIKKYNLQFQNKWKLHQNTR